MEIISYGTGEKNGRYVEEIYFAYEGRYFLAEKTVREISKAEVNR